MNARTQDLPAAMPEATGSTLQALNEEYLHRNMSLAKLYGIMQPSFGIFAGGGMVAVLGIGGVLE